MEPSYMETVAMLGVFNLGYLQISTLINSAFGMYKTADWNNIVGYQIRKMNDYYIDKLEAFELLDKQYYRCKKCQAMLTPDINPTLCKNVVQNKFLGMSTERICFFWCCENCGKITSKLICSDFDEKVEKYVKEEYEEDADTLVYQFNEKV